MSAAQHCITAGMRAVLTICLSVNFGALGRFIAQPVINVTTVEHFNNIPGRELIVMAAPSMFDLSYIDKFMAVTDFQVAMAKLLLGRTNVLILADRYTLPHLSSLPSDILLEADVYDIWLRQFAPIGVRRPIKYLFRPPDVDYLAATQIDLSLRRFLQRYATNAYDYSLVLDGSDVVESHGGLALVSTFAIQQNPHEKPQSLRLKLQSLTQNDDLFFLQPVKTLGPRPVRLDRLVSFLDNNTIAIANLSELWLNATVRQLSESFGHRPFKVVSMPNYHVSDHWGHFDSVCGEFLNALVTADHIFLPNFGADVNNRRRGYMPAADEVATDLVRRHTDKSVVTVAVKQSVCEMGGSPRSFTWQLKGNLADKLIRMARK